MKANVGIRAGDIYYFLENNGDSTLKQIKDSLKSEKGGAVDDLCTTLALGWLLREDKLELNAVPRGKSYSCKVSLKS